MDFLFIIVAALVAWLILRGIGQAQGGSAQATANYSKSPVGPDELAALNQAQSTQAYMRSAPFGDAHIGGADYPIYGYTADGVPVDENGIEIPLASPRGS